MLQLQNLLRIHYYYYSHSMILAICNNNKHVFRKSRFTIIESNDFSVFLCPNFDTEILTIMIINCLIRYFCVEKINNRYSFKTEGYAQKQLFIYLVICFCHYSCYYLLHTISDKFLTFPIIFWYIKRLVTSVLICQHWPVNYKMTTVLSAQFCQSASQPAS